MFIIILRQIEIFTYSWTCLFKITMSIGAFTFNIVDAERKSDRQFIENFRSAFVATIQIPLQRKLHI